MSNRLPVLASEIRRAHADVQEAARTAAERALEAGAMLVEAKALVAHGEWLPFLKEAGIPERSARRYMTLHRGGLMTATVADLGFATCERWASLGLKLWPKPGRAVEAVGADVDDDRRGVGMLATWFEASPGLVHYAQAYVFPEDWPVPDGWRNNTLALHTKHPVPPCILGMYQDGERERFDRFEVRDIDLAEADALLCGMGAGA